MKALIAIQFAIELDSEDELTELVRVMDESLFQAVAKNLVERGDAWRDGVAVSEEDGLVEWYGASISIKRSVLDLVEGGE